MPRAHGLHSRGPCTGQLTVGPHQLHLILVWGATPAGGRPGSSFLASTVPPVPSILLEQQPFSTKHRLPDARVQGPPVPCPRPERSVEDKGNPNLQDSDDTGGLGWSCGTQVENSSPVESFCDSLVGTASKLAMCHPGKHRLTPGIPEPTEVLKTSQR